MYEYLKKNSSKFSFEINNTNIKLNSFLLLLFHKTTLAISNNICSGHVYLKFKGYFKL